MNNQIKCLIKFAVWDFNICGNKETFWGLECNALWKMQKIVKNKFGLNDGDR